MDGVTIQVGGNQLCLSVCVEAVLYLLWDPSRAVAFGLGAGQNPSTTAQLLVEAIDFQSRARIGKEVRESFNLLHPVLPGQGG